MAEIKVNKGQWEEVDEETRHKILEGLRKVGALRNDETIVAAADAPAFNLNSNTLASLKVGDFVQLRDPFRDAACDIAAAGALAWCTANTAGVGYAACVAAAEAARNACKG